MNFIRRVISGEDMEQEEAIAAAEPASIEHRPMEESNNNSSPDRFFSMSDGVNVVENDIDMDAMHIASASDTPRSSLSDMSAHMNDDMDIPGDEMMDERVNAMMPPRNESKPPAMPRTPNNQNIVPLRTLDRNDSKISNSDSSSSVKGSSQNSSRDWGWFEDVHASEGALIDAANTSNNNQKRNHSAVAKNFKKKSKGTGGLVPTSSLGSADASQLLQTAVPPDLESEAAAMAVTAPTYVLEESLSSQKLWKYSAGKRPPQPVEERAFFEKMWAQNFARSQVEYQMPVEVLTAATPISLSPFADGNFDDKGNAQGLENYTCVSLEQSSAPQNAAEAALMSRMNDGSGPTAPGMSVADSMKPFIVKGKVKGGDGDLTVLEKGDNVFGTTVSKSFARASENGGPIVGVDTVNISVASYRVVETKKHGKYAQFLVIYREGSIRDTIGVWKRYSDFQELSKKVTQAHEGCAAVIANISPLTIAEEHEVEHLPNAITSWRLLKKRQRWYRCLDAGYLSLKVFLLERFLHDILFESSSPDLLRDFVGVDSSLNSSTSTARSL